MSTANAVNSSSPATTSEDLAGPDELRGRRPPGSGTARRGKSLNEANVRASLGDGPRARFCPAARSSCRPQRGMSVVDGFRDSGRGASRGERARARSHHRRRISRCRGCPMVQRARGQRPPSRPIRMPATPTAAEHAARTDKAEPREVTALDTYFVTVVRSRHECLDLCDTRRGLNAGRSVRRRHRRLLRADRPAAWRRAGAGAGNARCDRHARASSSRGWTMRVRAANG